jgi:hypothetical protein
MDQQPEERELLMFLLGEPGNLDKYVVCPSFQVEQQQSLAVQLPAALPSLKDAYIACAITLKQLQSDAGGAGVDTSLSFHYISKAMSTLRSLPVLLSQDTVVCHTLGSALAFAIFSAIGVGVPDICRYCLGATSSLLNTQASGTQNDPWESFLILLDTMDCFFHRLNPIRRVRVPSGFVVDRHLGLCLPLMPLYHDLCVISNSLVDVNDMVALGRLQTQLEEIYAVVDSWQPTCSAQLIEQFDAAEIVNLLAQAKVYRLAALLMCHRLRYPFGQEDVQADLWSKEVMMELDLAKRVTNQPMRFVTLPFIIAAVEVRGETPRSNTLQSVDDCVDKYAPFMQKATQTFLLRVWHERDLNLTSRWFDSVHKPCPVLNAISQTCFGG